jgi:saccharopine dehydrogenase-like NADP-dependent oxidoreductase
MVNSGFLNEDPVQVNETEVVPIEFTASLLSGQEQFRFGPEEADITMVRVDVSGWSGGSPKKVIYEMVDHRDMESGFTAMQRTVGYTMGLGARLILTGKLHRTGLISPLDVSYEMLSDGLAPYDIEFNRSESKWEGESG